MNIRKVASVRIRSYLRLIKFRIQLFKAMIDKNDRGSLPDVLCVGVPKAATTWLYFNLHAHPEVTLPPGKELHFFSQKYQVNGANPVFNHIKKNSFWNFQFDLSNSGHWRWYKSQFSGNPNNVKIDITPTYCRVSKERIGEIKQKLPGTKIILIIRDPISRAWSGASYFMDRDQGKSMDGLDLEREILPWVLDPERLDYGNYIDMIENWDSYYSDDQIKYIFYDDINSNPKSVLKAIAEFINIRKISDQNKKDPNKRVNSDYKKISMPIEIRNRLQEIYQPQIEFLEKRFKRNLSSWRN